MALKRLTSAAIFVVGVAVLASSSGCGRHFTDRELFQEAVAAGKTADKDDRWYIFGEIVKAQAARGYYDDALETSLLVDKYPDQLFVDVVSARAKNGDVAGAKKMAGLASTRETNWSAQQAIAFAQADAGHLTAARDTLRPLPPRFRQNVLQAIGTA